MMISPETKTKQGDSVVMSHEEGPGSQPYVAEPTKSACSLAGEGQLFTGKTAERRYKEVDLPISGLRVRIRSLTELEKSNWEAVTANKRGGLVVPRLQDAARRLIVLCLVDGAGNRILNQGHVTKLGTEWDSADVGYLYEECARHVGVKTEDLEELVKNSVSNLVE